ncbi:hypothetical protein EPH95_02350 [Salicibibacter halophilus]|uniref:Uncharacterized protein n=1 Tax=Salicibibacter halophilus TaxID=2502791 RepID=A0A514LF14_9BACI|nr:hypothetical protein [Salicibibacter halophilus]QDI90155.1 hypothetical protein EPH95_02350 [Salicibibacter halophilus]
MGTRHFRKSISRGRNGKITSFLRKGKVPIPWLWFIKDSVKEIDVRSYQTGDSYEQVINDYLSECRPFLTKNQINDLSNHLMNVFGVDENPYSEHEND